MADTRWRTRQASSPLLVTIGFRGQKIVLRPLFSPEIPATFIPSSAYAGDTRIHRIQVRRAPMLAMVESAPLDFLITSGIAYRYNPRGLECIYFAEAKATACARG